MFTWAALASSYCSEEGGLYGTLEQSAAGAGVGDAQVMTCTGPCSRPESHVASMGTKLIIAASVAASVGRGNSNDDQSAGFMRKNPFPQSFRWKSIS